MDCRQKTTTNQHTMENNLMTEAGTLARELDGLLLSIAAHNGSEIPPPTQPPDSSQTMEEIAAFIETTRRKIEGARTELEKTLARN